MAFCQLDWSNYDLNFDKSINRNRLIIDSNSIWQIAKPNKTTFNSANSIPNAIITDKDSTYPINDTSSFIIKNIARGKGFTYPHTVILYGKYFVDSDSLNDFGMIEFSHDNGNSWIDLINDTLYMRNSWWWHPKPNLTGRSNGWKEFYVNVAELGPILNIKDEDTILYRFTFISDSIDNGKDGLMFDDFHFEDYIEGIEEQSNSLDISIYPNPASDYFILSSTKVHNQMNSLIYNSEGNLVQKSIIEINKKVDISTLPIGMYYIYLYSSTGYSISKLIKQ